MPSTESPQPTESTNGGGLAPENRQCRYTLASGFHCRRWSIRGHDYCQEHGRWMECRVDGPIEVPLMEDPSAVQLVASQTVRAMGWGQIPPANGRAILHGCRVVQTGFAQQLAEAKFRLKCHQLGLSPDQFLRTSASPRVPHVSAVGDMGERDTAPSNDPQPVILSEARSAPSVILSEARSAESKDLHFTPNAAQIRVPHVSAVGDMGERDTAPSNDPQPVILSEARSASSVILSEARSAESKDLHFSPDMAQIRVPHVSAVGDMGDHVSTPESEPQAASPLPSNPLDDVPPPPRPQSACDPCVEALKQGADESLLDCKHCPAAIAGNLRAPQLPDPRNPPERPESGTSPGCGEVGRPKRPAFPNLKSNWDRALARFEGQCAGPRYPTRYPLQTDEEYADQLAAIRARPFDDLLHPLRTPPPPPLPAKNNPSS